MSFPARINGSPSVIVDRLSLPYGIWTCEDGREVLFNREYQPIWERAENLWPEQADPKEWVRWKTQSWFFDDLSAPWVMPKSTRSKYLKILGEFRDRKSVARFTKV